MDLSTPGTIAGLATRNRIVMAPMTRSRALARGVPSELAIEYYAQRASAGLIISEGIAPSGGGLGYARTPALESREQVQAWRRITDAVHAKGGRMFAQLMHVGRIAHADNRYVDSQPVAPSAVKPAGQMWTDSNGLQDLPLPRALETDEVPRVIDEYASATRNAVEAGFDGIELHAASGYLPMQFLSTNTNLRTDKYGGDSAKRVRFVVETLEAMIAAAGSSSRVGMKISPGMPFNDIKDADPRETYSVLLDAIKSLNLGYLHVLRTTLPDTFDLTRPKFKGTFAAGGGFTKASGDEAIRSGLADYVVFGKPFTSNPDLPERFARGAMLVEPNPATFYSPGPIGYVDFRPLE